MWCNHKFGEIKEGYQYCTKCGKAQLVPCNHQYEILHEIQAMVWGQVANTVIVNRCKHCGELREFSTKHGKYMDELSYIDRVK